MRHEPQGLDRYANADPSLHHNTVEEQPSREWLAEMIDCLKRGDYESAELIRSRNVPQSDEKDALMQIVVERARADLNDGQPLTEMRQRPGERIQKWWCHDCQDWH